MIDSSELVPGDLVDLSEESLQTFPADLVLLSGDAIVNESMLTGESVPVSKVPADDKAVMSMTSVGGDVAPDLGRHFLFCGTRIVRIRRTETAQSTVKGGEAVGMVVRTGFNTTKGALVRSMLFPKPMGFKFYRDSFRFIGVLAGIAGLGFLGSAFKFVELGVGLPSSAYHEVALMCAYRLNGTLFLSVLWTW
jgi:cation-transporting ATPase 13A3/4/5